MNYAYSPDTGEFINTAEPSEWMASTEIAPPNYNPMLDGCFFKNGAWVIVPGGDPAKEIEDYRAEAKAKLDATSITMERIQEAIIAGNTTYDRADVVAWATYRAALRIQIKATVVGVLPVRPDYPEGT